MDAFRHSEGFDREVYLRAPCEWNSKDTRGVGILRAPAHGLSDAPVAFRRPLRKYLVNSAESLSSVRIRSEVSPFNPRPCYMFRKSGGDAGAIATRAGDILGFGEPDSLLKARRFSAERFGKLEAQGEPFVHAGMELAQGKDFSVTLTQEDFAQNLKPLPTSPELWAGREDDDAKLLQAIPNFVSANWVSCVGLPRFRDQKSAPVRRGLLQGSMRSAVAM